MTIAIVGTACRYPDAASPLELWENVLASRRAFRRMPAERLRLADYTSRAGVSEEDKGYATRVAVLRDFEFDRVRHRVAASSFRAADISHWLALEVADSALEDAGFPHGDGIPHDTTGVIVGNTLTGEMTRAAMLRQRWPYVRRIFDAELAEEGWDPGQRAAFLERTERRFKSPFAPINEESLAGGLANTIAGRICNHFDLHGGGYIVDGACASSLLAVATGCTALADHDLDVAVVGGVDVSLDPFELVGFAKAGALAEGEMRVYDERAAGFFPGEGCGFLVLMRADDAALAGRPVRATIEGWGVSSDGSGGITRPELSGQLLALRRAYAKAGREPTDVAYFEGHGTGTAVGDQTELRAIRALVGDGAAPAPVVGSVKANIGHTKAAAGMAGIIKTVMALEAAVLPPTPGTDLPHRDLAGLRVLTEPEDWPSDRPYVAGVSGLGFGGINTHVVISRADAEPRISSARNRMLARSNQDAELFVFSADSTSALADEIDEFARTAGRLSRAELGDAATVLVRRSPHARYRAALVVRDVEELEQGLAALRTTPMKPCIDPERRSFIGDTAAPMRIGLLFPGQAVPARRSGGALRRRFPWLEDLYPGSEAAGTDDSVATDIAQPAIVRAELSMLRLLERCRVRAQVAIGHSLGELSALCWSGVLDEDALLRVVRRRGQAMAACPGQGSMVSLSCGPDEARRIAGAEPVALAACNEPRQTVLSGAADAVARVRDRARASGVGAVELPVSHAFHSPLVAPAQDALRDALAAEVFRAPRRRVISTICARGLLPGDDIASLLVEQLVAPVRFVEAVRRAAAETDIFIETGPGAVLADLAQRMVAVPTISTDAGGPSLVGPLTALAAAFVSDPGVNLDALVDERFVRPIDLGRPLRFLENPCEAAPLDEHVFGGVRPDEEPSGPSPLADGASTDSTEASVEASPLDPVLLVRSLAARRAELPLDSVEEEARLLGDLHLNSITVSELAQEAARRLDRPPLEVPLELSTATVRQLADALLESRGGTASGGGAPGARPWLRSYTVEEVVQPVPRVVARAEGSSDWTLEAARGHPFAASLRRRLCEEARGSGIVLCVDGDESPMLDAIAGAGRLATATPNGFFVVVTSGGARLGAFARSVHLELPTLTTCVVDVPRDERAVDRVLDEVRIAAGFHEAAYDLAGVRRVPVWRPLSAPSGSEPCIGEGDVVLATGGGKGIGAECALSIARATGARLAIIGRSDPDSDTELAENLRRFASTGVDARYVVADVADEHAVRAAVETLTRALGPPTVLLHAAGTNVPCALRDLTASAVSETLRPKVDGFRHLIASVDARALRVVVAFGSIIGRIGLPGEAHYALANEWLRREVEHLHEARPDVRCLVAEWSVWAGAGMAERLGRINALVGQGIIPISIEDGTETLMDELRRTDGPVARVATGRFGEPPTADLERPMLPANRFLERAAVHYPGVELVAECDLSTVSDPYLEHHTYAGVRLFPAVMALEAMAAAAMTLTGRREPVVFRDVSFERPIMVDADRGASLRVCAVTSAEGDVDLAIRSDETRFVIDHVRASLRRDADAVSPLPVPDHVGRLVQVNPSTDLYGALLFHGPTFHRVIGYRSLSSVGCLAEVGVDDAPFFGAFHSQDLYLGDAAARDAFIHAIQACVPTDVIVPRSVEQLVVHERAAPGEECLVNARERSRDESGFVYDIDVTGAEGRLLETWRGLFLHVVERRDAAGPWGVAQLGPVLENELRRRLRRSPEVIVTPRRPAENGTPTIPVDATGRAVVTSHRPDGRPERSDGGVSVARHGSLALAVVGPGPIACDVQDVRPRAASIWSELLGRWFAVAREVADETSEPLDVAATRVWCVLECMQKIGRHAGAVVVEAIATDGWVHFRAGRALVATTSVAVESGDAVPLVVAVLEVDEQHA
ncbi:MAG TPA: type I polyketide synthase [Acidimicrobiia bacterium]